jgi:hypothetical protein
MIRPLFYRRKCIKEHQKIEKERVAHEACYEMLKMRGFGKSKIAIRLLEHILYCKRRSHHFLNEAKN